MACNCIDLSIQYRYKNLCVARQCAAQDPIQTSVSAPSATWTVIFLHSTAFVCSREGEGHSCVFHWFYILGKSVAAHTPHLLPQKNVGFSVGVDVGCAALKLCGWFQSLQAAQRASRKWPRTWAAHLRPSGQPRMWPLFFFFDCPFAHIEHLQA